MRKNKAKAALRNCKDVPSVKALLREHNDEWAGDHKGRQRVVAMFKAKLKWLEKQQ